MMMSLAHDRGLSFDTIKFVIGRGTAWKEDLGSLIDHKKVDADQLPVAVLNWFKKLAQLIREEIGDKQFEQVIAASHLEVPQDFMESDLSNVQKNLLSLQEQVTSF